MLDNNKLNASYPLPDVDQTQSDGSPHKLVGCLVTTQTSREAGTDTTFTPVDSQEEQHNLRICLL